MDDRVIEFELPLQLYQQLATIARTRQLSLAEVARMAMGEWLERQGQLERGRRVLRELGEGLGEGPAPHDAARHHDGYLRGLHVLRRDAGPWTHPRLHRRSPLCGFGV